MTNTAPSLRHPISPQIMASFEGELEGQDDLMSLITSNGYHRFDWSAGTEISSTYHSQVLLFLFSKSRSTPRTHSIDILFNTLSGRLYDNEMICDTRTNSGFIPCLHASHPMKDS